MYICKQSCKDTIYISSVIITFLEIRKKLENAPFLLTNILRAQRANRLSVAPMRKSYAQSS